MVMKRYPSDISREQFGKILPILESSGGKTKPRTVDLYEVFCGVCYRKIIQNGARAITILACGV